jgi:hypothetical protein
LLSPKLEGTVLTFETIHHRSHGSAELGPNNKYRVAFLGPKEARLQVFRYGAKENDAAPGLKLVRREKSGEIVAHPEVLARKPGYVELRSAAAGDDSRRSQWNGTPLEQSASRSIGGLKQRHP